MWITPVMAHLLPISHSATEVARGGVSAHAATIAAKAGSATINLV